MKYPGPPLAISYFCTGRGLALRNGSADNCCSCVLPKAQRVPQQVVHPPLNSLVLFPGRFRAGLVCVCEYVELLHVSKVVPRLLVPGQSWNSQVQRIAAVCSGAVPGRQATSVIRTQARCRWVRVTYLIALYLDLPCLISACGTFLKCHNWPEGFFWGVGGVSLPRWTLESKGREDDLCC